MTKEETKQLFTKLKTTYVGRFNNMTYQDGVQMLETWHSILKDYDFQMISKNLDEHISKSPYFPRISELTKQNKTSSKFNNYEQSEKCTKEEWDNLVDLYNRYYHKDIKVGKIVDEYLEGINA